MLAYLFLFIAIGTEVVATSALKATNGFTKPLPVAIVVVGYTISFIMLSLSLRTIGVSVAYAIWAGLGTAGIALLGWLFYNESLNLATVLGIGLILAGVLVLHLFSNLAAH